VERRDETAYTLHKGEAHRWTGLFYERLERWGLMRNERWQQQVFRIKAHELGGTPSRVRALPLPLRVEIDCVEFQLIRVRLKSDLAFATKRRRQTALPAPRRANTSGFPPQTNRRSEHP
jgi:hypothetical protein